MIYTIENDNIKVAVSDLGAELQSIYSKETNREYLWQANVVGLWKSRAILMFPICGRLESGKYTFGGNEYALNNHGFTRASSFSVIEKAEDKIVLELKSNAETLKNYPFKFTLNIIYSLNGATVRTEFLVKNDGNPDLPFSVGGHPGFALPLEDGLNFEDHYVEFEQSKKRAKLDLSPRCFCTGTETYYPMEKDKIVKLSHELFAKDAIFLTDDNGSITLKSDKSKKFVRLSYNDTTHIGLWQTYGNDTNFVCIEPCHGVPATDGIVDDFATKNGFIHLKDGESYNYYFDITVG